MSDKWEHRLVFVPSPLLPIVAELDELGADGWQACGMTDQCILMKRPKPTLGELMSKPISVLVHNHLTRVIKDLGECPACDNHHKRAIKPGAYTEDWDDDGHRRP